MPPMLSDAGLQRVIRALLVQELGDASARRIHARDAAAWPDNLALGPEGLALDSLELLACGAAVNAFFRLHEAGVEDYLLAEKRLDSWCAIVRAGLRDGTSGITFRTSASTGAPKNCTHRHGVLAAETAHWAALFAGRSRIVQLVPAHHIYGFIFTVLLPERLGIPVLDGRTLSPGKLARALSSDDLLVGFPGGWGPLLRSLERLPPGIRAVSSTGPLPAASHRALCQAGASEVIEVYGSSETSGIGMRSSPESGFALLPRWRAGPDGASLIEAGSEEPVPLPDRAEFSADGLLHLRGRKDQVVQVGGINVFPAAIAARLAEHPLVAEAVLRLDTMLPEPRLKAFVTLRAPGSKAAARRALDLWCRANLSAAERPVAISVGTAIPRNAMGKPTDWKTAPARMH